MSLCRQQKMGRTGRLKQANPIFTKSYTEEFILCTSYFEYSPQEVARVGSFEGNFWVRFFPQSHTFKQLHSLRVVKRSRTCPRGLTERAHQEQSAGTN